MSEFNTILVCVSKHHGNTRQVAKAIAEVLNAPVVEPWEIDHKPIAGYDLIGLGSGIYFGQNDRLLLDVIESLPKATQKVFIFSTAGIPLLRWFFHWSLRSRLSAHGCQVVGEFICPGRDTVGPLAWFGGIQRNRPNERDLNNARQFARSLLPRMELMDD